VRHLPTATRGGNYYRVYKPEWVDPSDVSYSKQRGGRWNPAGSFGALYLNATVGVAAAQARNQHAGRAIKLFDLAPERRPMLATFHVAPTVVVDAVSADALRALRLPQSFPYGIEWNRCQRIGQRAFDEAIPGVASRSNAEATPTSFVGEELAIFDSEPLPPMQGAGLAFSEWYPDPIPG
jgi:RES domain-containing protein